MFRSCARGNTVSLIVFTVIVIIIKMIIDAVPVVSGHSDAVIRTDMIGRGHSERFTVVAALVRFRFDVNTAAEDWLSEYIFRYIPQTQLCILSH